MQKIMEKKRLASEYDYELKDWIGSFQSFPIAELEHWNANGGYAKREAHLFQLEDGNYAFVGESGCSCYTPSNASIEVFSRLRDAQKQFHKYVKEHTYEF